MDWVKENGITFAAHASSETVIVNNARRSRTMRRFQTYDITNVVNELRDDDFMDIRPQVGLDIFSEQEVLGEALAVLGRVSSSLRCCNWSMSHIPVRVKCMYQWEKSGL